MPIGGVISEEVDGMEKGGGVGGGENLVDDVFVPPIPDNSGTIGERSSGSADGGAGVEPEVGNGGVGENLVDPNSGAVGGVDVADGNDTKVGMDGGVIGGIEVPVEGAEERNNNMEEEGEIDNSGELNRDRDENDSGMGGPEVHSGGGAVGGGGAAVEGGNVESVVEPVHHIPRRRLYEILAHAEGECIVIAV